MFIRLVSGEIDGDSHVSAGLFTAFDLLYEPGLRDDEYYVLSDLIDWFNVHMKGPVYYRLKEPGVHREQSAGSSQQRTNTCHVRGKWPRF